MYAPWPSNPTPGYVAPRNSHTASFIVVENRKQSRRIHRQSVLDTYHEIPRIHQMQQTGWIYNNVGKSYNIEWKKLRIVIQPLA